MFREGTEPTKITDVNMLICDGGMGDLLCYLVVADYVKKNIPWVNPLVWVPDYLLEFAKNVLPEETCVRDFTTAQKKYSKNIPGLSTKWNTQHTPMRIHPIDYAFHMMVDCDVPIEKKNYLKFNGNDIDVSKFNLPEKYVTISVGATSRVKELPPEVLNQIVDHVVSKGYTPVFLGKEESKAGTKDGGAITANLAKLDYSKGLDLTNKTSVCETAKVISEAKLFIGMEGGLTHLAGFTDVPIVAGYSFINPEKMMPIRNNIQGHNVYPVVPDVSLECRFCQTNIPLLYDHDFRECYYGPDDYTCVKQLTFEKFKEQIDKCLL